MCQRGAPGVGGGLSNVCVDEGSSECRCFQGKSVNEAEF